jgi:hypothetical protein
MLTLALTALGVVVGLFLLGGVCEALDAKGTTVVFRR